MSTNERDFTPDPYVPEYLQKLERERFEAAKVSRRNFIKITGLAGGGLVLALQLGPGAQKALAQTAASGTFSANPYVQIKADGTIVLFAKNPEVGQGVKTSLPMIVAEELDADWKTVEVQQSVINRELYGAQVAGGSTSTPTNFESLRRAGATARAMLVAAAAKTWNVPEAELTTANSTVRQEVSLQQGIASDKAKEISKTIRDEKLKGVQAQIQGDQLRVSGKKKDDLQAVIALLKGKDFGIALQFTNYR